MASLELRMSFNYNDPTIFPQKIPRFFVGLDRRMSYPCEMTNIMDTQERSHILVKKAQAGDRDAFGELFERYRERVAGLAQKRLGARLKRRVDEEDVVQEVMLRAFASLSHFRWSDGEAFFRWLSGIVGNVVHEAARAEKRDLLIPSDTIPADYVSNSRAMGRAERFDRLKVALDTLKPDHREVILLARIRRLPIEDVAKRMGRSPDAVGHLLRRAIKKLKIRFGDTDSFRLPDRSLLDEEEQNDD